MKKVLLLTVLFLGVVSSLNALSVANTSCIIADETTTLCESPCYLDYITVSNSEAVPRRIDIWDSAVYKGSIMVPAKNSRFFRLKIRFASSLKVYMEGAHMFISAGYMLGPGNGHYPYGVRFNTEMETVYSNPGDIIGIMISNWDSGDTGKSITLSDSFTAKVRITCPVNDTVYQELDRFHLFSFQVTNEDTEVGTMLIRRE